MLGFWALGQFPLGQPGTLAVPVSVGSSISGGWFSKKRWHDIKEAERQRELAIVRAREAKNRREREIAIQAAAEAKAAREAGRAAADQAHAERARRQALIDALAAQVGARTIGDAFADGGPMAIAAARARDAQAQAAAEEEEAVVRMLLLE
jgi:threonine synthase